MKINNPGVKIFFFFLLLCIFCVSVVNAEYTLNTFTESFDHYPYYKNSTDCLFYSDLGNQKLNRTYFEGISSFGFDLDNNYICIDAGHVNTTKYPAYSYTYFTESSPQSSYTNYGFGITNIMSTSVSYSYGSLLTHLFDSKQTLTPNSRIKMFLNALNGHRQFIKFNDETGVTLLSMVFSDLTTGSNSCGATSWVNVYGNDTHCCDLVDAINETYDVRNNNSLYFDMSLKELSAFCPYFDNYITDIDSVTFGTISGTYQLPNGTSYFDDISIDFYSGTNELPYFNITYPSLDICLNEAGNAYFNYTLTATDAESDEIYYATSYLGQEKSFYKDYSVYNKALFFESYDPDFNSLSDGYIYYFNTTTDCGFCDSFLCPVYQNELAIFTVQSGDFSALPIGWDAFGLQMKNSCLGEDYYTVKTNYPYGEFYYNTSIYGLQNDETYYLKFLNSDFNEILDLKVYGNDTNLTIQTLTDTGFVQVFNKMTDYNLTSIGIHYNANGTFGLLVSSKQATFVEITGLDANLPISELNKIQYVQINFSDTSYLLQSFYGYKGEAIVLDFTTSAPTSPATFTEKGTHSINFYVSDSVHQPDVYDYQTVSVNVHALKSTFCKANYTGDFTDLDLIIGDYATNYFTSNNLNEKLDKFLIFLYAFMIIAFCVISFKVSSGTNINFLISTMLSGFICVFISLITHRATSLLIFIIMSAVSVATILFIKGLEQGG